MATKNLNAIAESYNKAGFRTVYRDKGAISFAKAAPVVVIHNRGRGRKLGKALAGETDADEAEPGLTDGLGTSDHDLELEESDDLAAAGDH
jgi:hypothetical protein